jgi:serine/threonine protein kinase
MYAILRGTNSRCHGIYAFQRRYPSVGTYYDKLALLNAYSDLKPENLLLDDAFRIKITDFGTGKVLENGGEDGC